VASSSGDYDLSNVGERRTEKAVKNGCARVAKRRGAWRMNTHMAVRSRRGLPDDLFCHRGVFVAMEYKSPANDHPVSPSQRLELRAIEKAGGIAGVVKDESDAEKLFDLAEEIAGERATPVRASG
jgi:hypothetical protein